VIGVQIPFVFVPRYSSFMGEGEYLSAPIDVTAYWDAAVSVWRGKLVGADTAFKFYVQVSTDMVTWTDFPLNGAGPTWVDPGEGQITVAAFVCTHQWVRAKVTLEKNGADEPAVTCWAAGLITERVE
jgi:hypothetical protein